MKFVTGVGIVAATTLAFGLATSADSRSNKRSQGYGYVTKSGVHLARVKPVEKMLKGCGINLGGLITSPYGRQPRRCNPNKKEYQEFHVITMRPGDNFEVVARTQGSISKGAFRGKQSIGLGTLKGNSRTCYGIVTYKGKKLVRVPVRSGRRDQYLFSNPLSAAGAERDNAEAALTKANQDIQKAEDDFARYDRLLRGSRAWNASSKQCFRPRQRALPRKPPPSPNTTLAAPAQCVENLTRHWKYSEVADGLNSEGRRDALSDHSKWNRQGARSPSCARNAADRTINRSTEFTPAGMILTWQRTHIANQFKKCVRNIRSSCGAAMNNWYSSVATIKSEPNKLYNSCRANQRQLNSIRSRYPGYQRAVANAKARVNAAPRVSQRMDLANARCGSTI